MRGGDTSTTFLEGGCLYGTDQVGTLLAYGDACKHGVWPLKAHGATRLPLSGPAEQPLDVVLRRCKNFTLLY